MSRALASLSRRLDTANHRTTVALAEQDRLMGEFLAVQRYLERRRP